MSLLLIYRKGVFFLKIIHGLVFHEGEGFIKETLYTEGDRFSLSASEDTILDAEGCYIIPGLIDIHFHGCAGHDFSDASSEGLSAIAAYQLSQGVTSICPASMTLAPDTLRSICECAKDFSKKSPAGGSRLVGINLEGPFISDAKRGAQNPDFIQSADVSLLKELRKHAGGLIKLVTLAPETENAMNFIQQIKNSDLKDISISIGHTVSDYDTAKEAFDRGANHVTHLFNAMPGFTHRAPGVIGAAFDSPGCFVEIICDGVHIAPPVIRAAFAMFGKERIVLISDSMRATGLSDGSYTLGGLNVQVNGKHATLADGTLAGSVTNLLDCIRCAAAMGIPLEDAVRCATINPARSIGIDERYGSLTPGKAADFLLLDKNLNLISIYKDGLKWEIS